MGDVLTVGTLMGAEFTVGTSIVSPLFCTPPKVSEPELGAAATCTCMILLDWTLCRLCRHVLYRLNFWMTYEPYSFDFGAAGQGHPLGRSSGRHTAPGTYTPRQPPHTMLNV